MSSPDHLFARTARLMAAGLIALGLAGCLRPLYGPTGSGEPLADVLGAIEVVPINSRIGQERLGHYIRSELIYDLDGSGQPRPKRYKLTLTVNESISSPLIDAATGNATSATVVASASYVLTSLDGLKILTQATATSLATYERPRQRFAAVRAARDAEIRAAKALAEQIKTRLAVTLASQSTPGL